MKRHMVIVITVSAFLVPQWVCAEQTPGTTPVIGDSLLQVPASADPVIEESAFVSGGSLPFDENPSGTTGTERLTATNTIRDPPRMISAGVAFDRRHNLQNGQRGTGGFGHPSTKATLIALGIVAGAFLAYLLYLRLFLAGS